MIVRTRRPGLAIAGLLRLASAGCAGKVSGHVQAGGATPTGPSGGASGGATPPSGPGQNSSSGPSSNGSGAGPSSGGSTNAPRVHLACPRVVDVAAHLGYDCVNGAMAPGPSEVWPVKAQRSVDTHWTSIPDVAKASWPKVPSIIKGLQIV
jgi:hypothetical protein